MTSKPHPKKTLRPALQPRLRELVAELWAREAAARDFGDPEGVHQMRVTSRKLRAALDAGQDIFSRKPERRLRSSVRRLARALGAVRDGDVMIAKLQARSADNGDHPGIARLVDRLDCDRYLDRRRLLELLDSLHVSGVRETSLGLFRGPGGDNAKRIRRRDARYLARNPRDAFLARVAHLPAEHDVEGLHQLRIATKRLRYVLQLTEPALAPRASELLGPLSEMQDYLGDVHNDDVMIALVRDELHALLDVAIDDATKPPDQAMDAARDDLVRLVGAFGRERHARYLAFASWWDELQATDFPGRIDAL